MPTVAATPTLGQYLDLQTVAARTHFGYSTLRAWIGDGRLPAVRVGRAYRVKESDVLKLFEPVKPNGEVTQ